MIRLIVTDADTEGAEVIVGVAEGLELTPPHVEVHCVPVNVPPFGQAYTGSAGTVIVHVVPDKDPPSGQW